MKLKYEFDETVIEIRETEGDGTDVEFHIRLLQDRSEAMEQVREEFDENRISTDVLFYPYPDGAYRIIVRKDFYEAFVLELMRRQLLRRVTWEE